MAEPQQIRTQEISAKARGALLTTALSGAALGAVLGAILWLGALSPSRGLKANREPLAQDMASLLAPVDACFTLVSVVIGAGVGGAVGAGAGALLGRRA